MDVLAASDPRIDAWVTRIGPPPPRQRPQGFETLVRIIVGQQVSVRAADGIWTKLEAALGKVTPEAVLQAEQLPGFSRAKGRYARCLAESVLEGRLNIDALAHMPDDEAEAAITQITGFGPWSAHIYLMFALGRPDIWPVGDLAVRGGFGKIMGLPSAPDQKASLALGAPFRPHRSVLALLCWHAYSSPAL